MLLYIILYTGKGVVKTARMLIGATRPQESAPGTIRGDLCIDVGRNVIHGSDSVESAQKEISLWFKDGLVDHEPHMAPWIYE